MLFLSVHLSCYRMFKVYMTQVFGLMYSRLRIQKVLIIYTVIYKRVDCEITDTERSQVLKKVRSLAGIDTIVCQPGFYNNTCCTDMRPFYRNAEPCIATAPAARAYQDLVLSFVQELLVQFFYLPGYFLIVGSAVIIGFYVNYILQFIHYSMS